MGNEGRCFTQLRVALLHYVITQVKVKQHSAVNFFFQKVNQVNVANYPPLLNKSTTKCPDLKLSPM